MWSARWPGWSRYGSSGTTSACRGRIRTRRRRCRAYGAATRFPLDDDLVKVFTFNRITAGVVPTEDQLFAWIKDVFRDVFNSFGPPTRQSVDFTERGLEATEYLTAYIHALLIHYRSQLREGEAVPDTMLTRLLRLQLRVAAEGDERLRAALGPALPPGTAAARLSDSMIRSNVLGTVVGAVVNPQEATARIVDSLLRLQDGEYPVRNGSSFLAPWRRLGPTRTRPATPRVCERCAATAWRRCGCGRRGKSCSGAAYGTTPSSAAC